MSRFFNGSGYHGARKNGASDVGTCPCGHIYSLFEIVDDRKNGGSCFRRRVKECPKCKANDSTVVVQSGQGTLLAEVEELI